MGALLPFFQVLVSKHPAKARRGETGDQARQQHVGAHRLGHRRRLHQELQLPLLSGFYDERGGRKRERKRGGPG